MLRGLLSAALVAAQAQSPAPVPDQMVVRCAQPDVPGRTIHTVLPEIPALAEQQGVFGSVLLVVTLDEQSHLTSVAIQSSPSATLNASALQTARHTAFGSPIRNCRAVAGKFTFLVDYDAADPGVGGRFVGTKDGPAALGSADGTASRPADMAYVHAEFATSNADRATAIAANDAAFEKFRSALAPLRISSEIATGYYNVLSQGATPASPTAKQYAAAHEAIVAVVPLAGVRDVLRVAANAGATNLAVRYSVRNKDELFAAAVDTALRNTIPQAARVARERGLSLGNLLGKSAFAGTDPSEPGTLLTVRNAADVPAPVPVEARVHVSATYALHP
jgi:TonB family protein